MAASTIFPPLNPLFKTLSPFHSIQQLSPFSSIPLSATEFHPLTMKARVRSNDLRPQALTPSFYTYLKPGALAQLRYSKITARSKEIGAQALIALSQVEQSSDPAFPGTRSTGLAIDGMPCFNLRIRNYPRCLQRKKLIAVTQFFSETH